MARRYDGIDLVALRKESVDRNRFGANTAMIIAVALRKESVDRNIEQSCFCLILFVVLRKESVDRNKQILEGFGNGK